MKKAQVYNNDYAHDKDGRVLFIDDVEKGKKGYYCIGCQSEMIAYKSKKNRRHYFGHDKIDVHQPERNCPLTSETFRHQETIKIFNRLKRIKVPAVFKRPPKNEDGPYNLLSESTFIEAAYTQAEVYFFETENGNVGWGKTNDGEEKNFLIKPDVVFFNADNQPILFVEVVHSHKVDYEKLAKIKRLGIDTVEYHVQRASLEDIENNISTSSKRVYWIYNGKEEDTEYIYSTAGFDEKVPGPDEEQERIYGELIKCRFAEINNLIRSIGKCFRTEPYLSIEAGLREEIQRVEEITKRVDDQVQELRAGIRERVRESVDGRYRDETRRIDSELIELEQRNEAERGELDRRGAEIAARYTDLENRYLKRRKELTTEQGTIGGNIGTPEQIKNDEAELRRNLKGNLEHRRWFPERFADLERKEQDSFEEEGRKIEEEFICLQRDEIERINGIREQLVQFIEGGVAPKGFKTSTRCVGFREARRICHSWEQVYGTWRRNRTAYDSLK